MPHIRSDADLMADLAEMQEQLLRCKGIPESVTMLGSQSTAA